MTPAACGSAMDCRPPDGEHRCADLHPHRARRGGGRPFSRRPNPIEQNIVDQLAPPSADYPLGADNFGRDVLFRLLWGARFSLLVSFSPSHARCWSGARSDWLRAMSAAARISSSCR